MIYFDSAATTQIDTKVFEEMTPYLTNNFGNPGALYSVGRTASSAIEVARERVANFIGAKPEQIIFTSGGTEANNLAILGTAKYLSQKGKPNFVTSQAEHESVLRAGSALCGHSDCGATTIYLDVDREGKINVDQLKERYGLGLASFMYVNNEVGTLNPIKEIGSFCKENDILFHTDCVQATGSFELNVDDIQCDFLSISSHKIHGPKGVGALYVRNKEYLFPIINGGQAQEFGLRGGTENVAGIVGFGKACELAMSNMKHGSTQRITKSKTDFFNLLTNYGLSDIMSVNGLKPHEAGKILNITFEGIDAQTLVLMLDSRGVCVSAGAACCSKELEPSHVLTSMGLTQEQARSSIRISFSENVTFAQSKEAAQIIADCVRELKNF